MRALFDRVAPWRYWPRAEAAPPTIRRRCQPAPRAPSSPAPPTARPSRPAIRWPSAARPATPRTAPNPRRVSPGGSTSTTTSHTHPFQPETTGVSGAVTIPTRNETSDNIWFRFHLRATDSAGLATEVTRDILPRKAQFTLATQPAGLALTLDGQPVTGPATFTGVVGTERDLGAVDQEANGRRYRFVQLERRPAGQPHHRHAGVRDDLHRHLHRPRARQQPAARRPHR